MKNTGYNLIGYAIFVGIWCWILPPLGAAIGIILIGSLRKKIIHLAPFWDKAAILIAGIVLGSFIAIGVNVAAHFATSSTIIRILLYIEGLVCVLYFGYEPDPIDTYKKAEQTSIIGAASYLIVLSSIIAIRTWL